MDIMSLDTLLKAAEYVESSSEPNTKENPSHARGNLSSHAFMDRRRVVSESDATERRRRPGGAGTRETHNKLEKNRRAHLKECFDILKKQVPNLEEKKTSNLNILRSALKYIQTMKKKEEDYISECDLLKTNNQTLLNRIVSLKTKTKGEKGPVPSTASNDSSSSSKKPNNCLPPCGQSGDCRIPPISVATQTSPSLEKDGKYDILSSVSELEEVSNTCISTSSTDTGLEGDELDRKISICDDDDEKTDTDDGLNNEDDNDQDFEIDVVGHDSSSSESLRVDVENKIIIAKAKMNGKLNVEKRKGPAEPRGRNTSKYTNTSGRKRSKSEMKCEEDSDYDENTKEEPKAKIQACARVSV
ncbi:hypothetical protein QZH41_013272 [Actinostola sp. cb2023]|nr:hypothetical protein QZH41_013272 [Actinostola sp. cb2023]